MGAHRNKRGLMAPQPAAQIAALDFAHQSQAVDRAFALASAASTDAELDASADVLASCIDRLLAIPARAPAELAQKVRGQAWRFTDAGDLADEAQRRRVFASTDTRDDDAKGLLTVYLDLTAQASATPTADLTQIITGAREAFAAFEAVCRQTDEVQARNDGRVVTAADLRAYERTLAAVDKALTDVRSYPANRFADALAKQDFLRSTWHFADEDNARANYDALLADMRRLGGVQ